MKIICLEEHVATSAIIAAWQRLDPATRDLAIDMSIGGDIEARLRDTGEGRIAAMDAAGIDVSVLSHTAPGVQDFPAKQAVPLAREANDVIADAVSRRPDRFQGLATLPTPDPEAAARELERAVKELGLHGAMPFGRTGAFNFSYPSYLPILETAAALRAPLYLHPQSPQPKVRQAYYQNLGDGIESLFGTAGIGWHYETGVQLLRLIVSGVFDRLPDLRFVLGHWGEVVLFYLDRIDLLTGPARLPRKVSDYFRTNIWITPGGILSQRYLRWAIEVIGADRILMAADYPFGDFRDKEPRRFLEEAPIDDADRRKIALGNWQRLVDDIRR